MFLHGVSPCMQFQPQAALRNQDTGVYLIARAMASAEAAKEIRCAQCNEFINTGAAGVRCKNKAKQQFACGKCLSVEARLRGLLGTWPLDELKDCAEQDTIDFAQDTFAVERHSLPVQVKS